MSTFLGRITSREDLIENPNREGPEGGIARDNWVFWVDWNALEGSDVSIGQTAMILPVHELPGGPYMAPSIYMDPAEMESVFTQIFACLVGETVQIRCIGSLLPIWPRER